MRQEKQHNTIVCYKTVSVNVHCIARFVYLRTLPYAALVESSISSYCTAGSCSVAGLNSTCSYRWSSPAAVADEGSSYLALVLDDFGRALLGEPMHICCVHVCRATCRLTNYYVSSCGRSRRMCRNKHIMLQPVLYLTIVLKHYSSQNTIIVLLYL